MAGVSVVDLALGAVVLISALLAFARGFTREVFATASWISAGLAAYAVFKLVPESDRFWRSYIDSTDFADPIAATVAFIATLVVTTLVTRFIASKVHGLGLGSLDRSLGFLFGIVRGGVFVCIVYLLFIQVVPPEEQPDWLGEARTRPMVEAGSGMLLKLVDEDTRKRAEETLRQASEQADKARGTLELYEQLAQPPAAVPSDDAAEGDVGYNDDERNQIGTILKSTEGEGQ